MTFIKYAHELCETINAQFGIAVSILDSRGMVIRSANAPKGKAPCLLLSRDLLADGKDSSRTIQIRSGGDILGYIYSREPMAPDTRREISAFVNLVARYEERLESISIKRREEADLVSRLLSADAGAHIEEIKLYAADLGYQITHPMSVVTAFIEPQYVYCLNMNLGYETATSDAIADILENIRNHQFMNKQDITSFVQNNFLVILKAIEDVSDLPRLYRMQREIEKMLDEILSSYRIFNYSISSGKIVSSLEELHLSFQEATQNIRFAKSLNIDHTIVTTDDVLFCDILSFLPRAYYTNVIQPCVQALQREKRETVLSLTQCYDAYLNHGMSAAAAADGLYLHRNTVKKRLEKLYKLTDLDPNRSFQDALNLKLVLQQYWLDVRSQEQGGFL